MKRTLVLALVALLVLVVAPAYAGDPIAYVDFFEGAANDGVVAGTNVRCSEFYDDGGVYSSDTVTYMITYRPGHGDDSAGYCHFQWDTGDKAHRLELAVLDARDKDNSFEVHALSAVGKWVTIYKYRDQDGSDAWNVHTVKHVPTCERKSGEAWIKIIPTADPDNSWPLAVDYVTLYDNAGNNAKK
jgi:hypothetical protein